MTSSDPGARADRPAASGRPAESASWAESAPEDAGLLSPVRAGGTAEARTGDAAFLQAMLNAEAALTRAQAAVGLAPRKAADVVSAVVAESAVAAPSADDRFDARDLALRARSGGNPVIPLVAGLTDRVTAESPDAGAHVHRGATSQDILDSALMLVAARTLDATLPVLERTAGHLALIAAEHRDTPMPGRTLTQHAVPTTFGLKAAGWRSLVLDAYDRLAAVRATLPAQLGGAAGTLAAFGAHAEAAGPAGRTESAEATERMEGVDGEETDTGLRLVTAYARELGLAAPALPWHTLRTPVADLASALAFTCGALGKLAADVLVLSRSEIGEVAEGSGGGSSAMPHKSNPVRATLIASAARQAPALTATLLGSLAAEDERPGGAWHAEWQPLRELLRLTGGAADAAAVLTEGLRVFPDRMAEHLSLTGGLLVSERVAAALGPLLGSPSGDGSAKQLLTDASRAAVEKGVPLDVALEEAEPRLRELLSPEDLRELTDPTRYTGAAPALTDRALTREPHGAGPPSRQPHP